MRSEVGDNGRYHSRSIPHPKGPQERQANGSNEALTMIRPSFSWAKTKP